MFVVARDGEIAVNIEKAEKIQLAYYPVREKYSIEAVLSSTGTTELDKYDTFEYAQYAFHHIILSIAKGDKVFSCRQKMKSKMKSPRKLSAK